MSGLPKGWAETDLMEIIELHDSVRVPLNKSERSAKPGPYPYYGANGLVDHIDEYLFDGEFVLLAEDGGNFDVPGKPVAYRVDGRFWVNNHAHIMKPRASIPASFLLHWCNNWNWMPFVGGTTRLKLTQEGMRKVRLALPPLAEQKRIVAKLDALNAKSARARTELARIETLVSRYKQAVLSKAFSGELTSADTANANNAEILTDGVVGYPSQWRQMPLGEIADIKSGITLGKRRKPDEHLLEVPYLRVANVQRGWLDLREMKTVQVTAKEANALFLREGDVLMNEGGDRDKLGRGWVWDGQIPDCIHQNHVFRVRLASGTVPPRFLSYYANEFGQEHFFNEGKQTTNLASISKSKLSAMQVPVPPFEEAMKIVRGIEFAFAKIDRLAAEARRALELVGKLDDAILGKAFRGELVSQDESDDPASVLLEHVGAERALAPNERTRTIRRKTTMSTARDFLNAKLQNWPKEGFTFQALRHEFRGSYDDLKEAVFASLSDEKSTLQQVFDQKTSMMTIRKRER
ncbi:hypothetical protein ASD12_24600 [Mesorhizobium sp. Root102]|uniref:restriction endonuclease subunit S n=1 Tax=Mesorhizobium sp. Root102 TaxID=1736422 RepID=UPI0007010534|nr:restriction endonuclease subunit S [Mesorhizobium sp. Root102]KQU94909.1 hypothetical protein ASD12_24600 [Mesorhizobium sp. Root102]